MTQTPVTDEPVEVPPAPQPGLRDAFNEYVARVRGGDVGPLPAILGLAVLLVIFSVLRPDTFTNSFNFANLLIQSAPVIVIAMGLVFVLLLGEIDLSAGFASGMCAAVLAVLLTNRHWPWYLAVLAAMATGLVIGLVLGTLVAKVRIPSFVVTLAAFLAFQGVALLMLKNGSKITGYVYQGRVNGIKLSEQIAPGKQRGTYNFKADATGVLPASSNPVSVTLTIASDSSTASVRASFK
jgi:D-xylose transport system permease protein